MKNATHTSLWRWICIRVLLLAIGSVVLIALCMWLRFAVQAVWVYHRMPPALVEEFTRLRQHPASDPARFHQIVDQYWGINFSDPSLASSDWLTVILLVVVTIPLMVLIALRFARPLSAQFSQLATAARAVSQGEFGRPAAVVDAAPQELVRFTEDFNQMTQQLARYERELRASHVAMAHELRSPLTAAMGRLQGILDGVFPADPQQLTMIMKQLTQLSRLTDELHLLSLADAGQLTLNPECFNPAELLRERTGWLLPQAEQAGLTLRVKAPDNLLLCADAFRLGQVVTILCENALRYAADGGVLLISASRDARATILTFRDYGQGVDPDFLPQLFDRFTRADSSRARHSGGSGLGLSIAKAIVDAHGGTITASLPADGGLLIRITLPDR
ncbi:MULTISPECIES: cell wall metabolism sensor histidine kinase WalK [Pantoea]|uniref:sensor histidine kinase n=1 Tax=Pantoea TaxID=53335 RepID=UPI0012318F12|nr:MULTISPECIES: ATP-binding protein [Pantoea]KAF6655546.1 HAMP domain-containing protein [Enterobacteriaceae bacterium EKM102V]KAA5967081.1 HAMP domain-containing protein [Pantoea sp. M_6]KAA5973879.1 HAMP domain-containing protein [Pantoea sp. M_8]KAA5987069.1 HAMP domain-containing protein [Pantoea sp. M_10]KAA6000821.1 HAMP domain-containing protein [Pantoea sp. M_5]